MTVQRVTDYGYDVVEALAAGARQRCREDQRAALPLVQGDHGREEEAGRDPRPGRPRRRGCDGRASIGAWSSVQDFAARPPRAAGTVVTDEGDGGTKVAEFLAAQKFI